MRTMRALLILLVIALAGVSLAQDVFDMTVSDVALLQEDSVRKDLSLTATQREVMNRMAEQFNAVAQARGQTLSKNNPQLTPAELMQDEAVGSALKKMRAGVLSLLSPSQLRRLREITLQAVGPRVLASEEIGERVKLSDDQRKKIADVYQKTIQAWAETVQEAQKDVLQGYEGKEPSSEEEAKAWQEDIGTKMQAADQKLAPEMRRRFSKADQDALAVLNATQKKAWQDLQGRKFTFPSGG